MTHERHGQQQGGKNLNILAQDSQMMQLIKEPPLKEIGIYNSMAFNDLMHHAANVDFANEWIQ